MNIDGKPWRTIWLEQGGHPGAHAVGVIDQTQLPHRFTTRTLSSCEEAAEAIRRLRGLGIRTAMLSGDRQAVADAVAAPELEGV